MWLVWCGLVVWCAEAPEDEVGREKPQAGPGRIPPQNLPLVCTFCALLQGYCGTPL